MAHRRSDGVAVRHPSMINHLVDDMIKWPEITHGEMFYYFVLSSGVDGSTLKNDKSTEAYQYLHSGEVVEFFFTRRKEKDWYF